MSRLVVVSNRVSLPGMASAGGLAVALQAALSERGGLWFGWSGRTTAQTDGQVQRQQAGNITYLTLDLGREDVEAYYNGFSNRTLWPLLHFRLDLVDYDRATRAGYERVNAMFARALAPHLREDDTVWIHDYHLIPLAAMLREQGIGCRIGFFLHVPVPSADLLHALPNHQQLFTQLYACDLVGFQTRRDSERFLSYVRLFGGGEADGNGRVTLPGGRTLQVGAFPISIDTARVAAQAAEAVNRPAVRALRASVHPRQLAIGVDRLDYSKGLPERFEGIDRLLDRHPDLKGQLTFLQIAPVSRGMVPQYRALRADLERHAGHINGKHARPDWTPLRYVNQNYGHGTLTGFYRLARIGLVTPLRDGMNLVAKEYLASQDPADPGVLVLSLLAGAADELEGALLVNPYDLDGVADALARAATMPLANRRERWEAMMAHLRQHDIHHWRNRFLEALETCR